MLFAALYPNVAVMDEESAPGQPEVLLFLLFVGLFSFLGVATTKWASRGPSRCRNRAPRGHTGFSFAVTGMLC